MMGLKQKAQAALFYEFSLEEHVPRHHLLRSIDRFVDLDGIRSERRLCEEVYVNLAYRWFCRLDLPDQVPDHSTFSKNRHGRFRESELLRHLFESTVARCIEEGLVDGQRFAVDASLIGADARKKNATLKEDWDAYQIDPEVAPRAVREYLETLDEAAFSAATTVKPKRISHSDPASQWTVAHRGRAFFAYSDSYLIDTDNSVIIGVEATRSIRQAEVGSTLDMLERGALTSRPVTCRRWTASRHVRGGFWPRVIGSTS